MKLNTALIRDCCLGLLLLATVSMPVTAVIAHSRTDTGIAVAQAGQFWQQQSQDFEQARTAFDHQDYALAAKLLPALAQGGHIEAQYLLATLYDTGLGLEKNVQQSFYWYQQAAFAGIAVAQHNLAVAYARGQGTAADLKKAMVWWTQAAEAGNTDSQYNLGIIYAAGRGHIKPDLQQAIKWWRMAANNGDAAAQFNLGALYANERKGNSCEATRWWKKSAKNGFRQAELALAMTRQQAGFAACDR